MESGEQKTGRGGELPQRTCPHGFPTVRSTVLLQGEHSTVETGWFRDFPLGCRICGETSPFCDYQLPPVAEQQVPS